MFDPNVARVPGHNTQGTNIAIVPSNEPRKEIPKPDVAIVPNVQVQALNQRVRGPMPLQGQGRLVTLVPAQGPIGPVGTPLSQQSHGHPVTLVVATHAQPGCRVPLSQEGK